jgi:hypothetical protein
MNKQISPGELHSGMIVTVLENKPFIQQQPSFSDSSIETIAKTDRSGMGDVHTILAVDLPYAVLRKEERDKSSYIYKIDTRRTFLMELDQQYVFALCPHLKPINA